MNPRVKEVIPSDNYTLILTFENGEKKKFDVKPYLEYGIFSQLHNSSVFYTAKAAMGTVQWETGQDFCPDTLYLEGKPL